MIKMKTMIINKKILRTILYKNFRDNVYIIENYIEKIQYIYTIKEIHIFHKKEFQYCLY